MSRLCHSQLSWTRYSKHHCDNCLMFFKTMEKFENHVKHCQQLNECAIKFPDRDYIKFENYFKMKRLLL